MCVHNILSWCGFHVVLQIVVLSYTYKCDLVHLISQVARLVFSDA